MKTILAAIILTACTAQAQSKVAVTDSERRFGVREVVEWNAWRIRTGILRGDAAVSFSGTEGQAFCYATQKIASGWILGVRRIGDDDPIWFLQAPDSETIKGLTYTRMHITGWKAPLPVTMKMLRNGTLRIDSMTEDAGTLSVKIGTEIMQFDITGAQRIKAIVAGGEIAAPPRQPERPVKPQPPP